MEQESKIGSSLWWFFEWVFSGF